MGLRLSQEKTLITHIDEGLDFLGWRIQRQCKTGHQPVLRLTLRRDTDDAVLLQHPVDHTSVSADELWDEWKKEVNAAEGAIAAGKIKHLYKVTGQRRVPGVIDADSHEELDRIFMTALPMAHMPEFEEILPVREYADFADDVRARWK
jgi:muconolactone D-isomerase